MPENKIVLSNGEVLIDLTEDTVTEDTLAEGATAHNAAGEQITGRMANPASGDYIPVPETAEVGQTIRVSAVDENDKPTAWEAVDFPSGGASEWELLSKLSVPADAAEATKIKITFPVGYSTYLLIANLEAPSASSALVVYPTMRSLTADGTEVGYKTAFWDYYHGANACRLTLYFEQEEFDGVMHYRMHGRSSTKDIGKPETHQDSGWATTENTKKYQFIRWEAVELSRTIAPLSGYTLLGRR